MRESALGRGLWVPRVNEVTIAGKDLNQNDQRESKRAMEGSGARTRGKKTFLRRWKKTSLLAIARARGQSLMDGNVITIIRSSRGSSLLGNESKRTSDSRGRLIHKAVPKR